MRGRVMVGALLAAAASSCFSEARDVGETASSGTTGTSADSGSTTTSDSVTGSTSTTAGSSAEGTSDGTSAATTDADSTGAPTAECGDGVVDPGELCDDGMANGTMPRGCRSDCAGYVAAAWISVWTGSSSGGLGPADADLACSQTFGATARALLVQPKVRVASVTPYAGDGQIDWPLQPHTAYLNADSQVVWVTDDVALLGVHNGQPEPLWAPISPEITIFNVWTGMAADWTAHDDNCNGWTNVGFGRVGLLGTTSLDAAISGTTDACSGTQNKVYCVHSM